MKRVTIVEGRTQGKIVLGGETLTGKTKPEDATATKLKRIAQRSGEDPQAELNWLMPHFNEESLIGCFNELDGKKAVGVDSQTKEKYGRQLRGNIRRLIARMKKMAYRPGPVREVRIPKEGSKRAFRTLGISNVEDKIVQLMMSKILTAIYELIFRDCSYGFRPGRSCHMAIRAVRDYLFRNSCEVVIDIDIKDFFGSLNHKRLMEMLEIKIKDKTLLRYIVRMLRAGVLSNGELKVTEEGSPQGSIVSPILANVYAHYTIDCWFEDVVKKHVRGAVELYRYCDDMVICCQYRSDAEKIKRALIKRLERFSLSLNEEKTKIIPFNKWKYKSGHKQGTFDFLGFTFYIGQSRRGYSIVKVKTSSKRFRSKLKRLKKWIRYNRDRARLKDLWMQYRVKVQGHVRYYGVSFNTDQVSLFRRRAAEIFVKWINRRSQRKSITLDQFWKFFNEYPLPKATVYHHLF